MGTITKGILGGFSGTVGTVVGANWRGKDIIRSRPKPSSKAPSEKQLLQQMKFKLAIKFIRPLQGIMKVYFGNQSGARSRVNLAGSHVLNEAVSVNAGIPELIFNKILITKGELAGFQNLTVTPQANRVLKFAWEDNSAQGNAHNTDVVCTVVYSKELDLFDLFDNLGQRDGLTGNHTLPESFTGKAVQVYAYLRNAAENSACNSVYLGEHTVL